MKACRIKVEERLRKLVRHDGKVHSRVLLKPELQGWNDLEEVCKMARRTGPAYSEGLFNGVGQRQKVMNLVGEDRNIAGTHLEPLISKEVGAGLHTIRQAQELRKKFLYFAIAAGLCDRVPWLEIKKEIIGFKDCDFLQTFAMCDERDKILV